MSHIWMSHVTHMNVSYHTHEWIMSSTRICHDTHIYGACHTYKAVVSHTWMRHITHMNESCHTHEWVMSHNSLRACQTCLKYKEKIIKRKNSRNSPRLSNASNTTPVFLFFFWGGGRGWVHARTHTHTFFRSHSLSKIQHLSYFGWKES